MPIQFSTLASHLQIEATKKLEFVDYTRFRQSSHGAFEISDFVRCKLAYPVKEVLVYNQFSKRVNINTCKNEHKSPLLDELIKSPGRIITETLSFENELTSNEMYYEIAQIYNNSGMKVVKLKCVLSGEFICNLSVFNDIVELLQLKHLEIGGPFVVNYQYFKMPTAFKNLETLVLGGTVQPSLMFDLHTSFLTLSCKQRHITPLFMNFFIKNSPVKRLLFKTVPFQFPEKDDKILLDDLVNIRLWNDSDTLSSLQNDRKNERAYMITHGQLKMFIFVSDQHFYFEILPQEAEVDTAIQCIFVLRNRKC